MLTETNQHESEEQRICAAATPLDAERFRLPASADTYVMKDVNAGEGAGSVEVGQKVSRELSITSLRCLFGCQFVPAVLYFGCITN